MPAALAAKDSASLDLASNTSSRFGTTGAASDGITDFSGVDGEVTPVRWRPAGSVLTRGCIFLGIDTGDGATVCGVGVVRKVLISVAADAGD
jgi:hypothetical protein